MRGVLLINPVAGGGLTVEVAGLIARHLRAVCELRVVIARDAPATAAAADRAVAEGADLLVVAGGDGAAHLAVQSCAGTATALAPLPCGTGNDLARGLGLPPDPLDAVRQVVRAVRAGRRRRVDLGKIAGGGYFGTVLCAGFDAAVNARANRMRWPRGQRRYDAAVLAELARLRPMPLRVELDGIAVELTATLVAVGNSTSYGGGIPICPDADLGDGLFDVTVVGAVRRRDLLGILPRLRTGRHVDHPAVRAVRARRVRLGGANGWLAHADGEPQARLPVSVRCAPGALEVAA
ncbi:diacylglycerol/lipid kinase family protein [Saccharopolyspora cebuensis]|uniref:Diacylglycerol kinase family protein n=1 Tax=Saccharopolyspora cebuensis TaxID=418759 RepID=A0ABV4CC86_9PSEU